RTRPTWPRGTPTGARPAPATGWGARSRLGRHAARGWPRRPDPGRAARAPTPRAAATRSRERCGPAVVRAQPGTTTRLSLAILLRLRARPARRWRRRRRRDRPAAAARRALVQEAVAAPGCPIAAAWPGPWTV